MVNPKKMCNQHILGEHVELHMFVGSINKGKSIKGYIKNKLIQPKDIKSRHEQLVKEMIKRGFKHKSKLPKIKLSLIDKRDRNTKINIKENVKTLMKRCKNCRKLAKQIIKRTNHF